MRRLISFPRCDSKHNAMILSFLCILIIVCTLFTVCTLKETPIRSDRQPIHPALGSWEKQIILNNPPAVCAEKSTYNSKVNRVIMFGGWQSSSKPYLNETWVYDYLTNSWMSMSPSTHPNGRESFAMCYDSVNDRVILFGGYGYIGANKVYYSDTWVYDYNNNTWTDMAPASHPDGRCALVMVFDTNISKCVLFGGKLANSNYVGDTWTYSYNTNTWLNVNPTIHPAGRCVAAMAYDIQANMTILFGGKIGYNSCVSETWVYSSTINKWTRLTTVNSPSGRQNHEMVYDTISNRVVLFGGGDNNDYTNDETWFFWYGNSTWKMIDPQYKPTPRSHFSMSFEPVSGKAIIYGGWVAIGATPLNETWLYDWTLTFVPTFLPSSSIIIAAFVMASMVFISYKRHKGNRRKYSYP